MSNAINNALLDAIGLWNSQGGKWPELVLGSGASPDNTLAIAFGLGTSPNTLGNCSDGSPFYAPGAQGSFGHGGVAYPNGILIFQQSGCGPSPTFGAGSPYTDPANLYNMFAHEIGHHVGLGHDDCANGVMNGNGQILYDGTPKTVTPEEAALAAYLAQIGQTYTLRGSAVWPQESYFRSVGLTAEFATPDGGGGNEVLNVTSLQTVFAFSTPLVNGTTYRVVPTVPDDLDCFLGPDAGTVSGGDPPAIRLFCTDKTPSFCDLYPHACGLAGPPDPYLENHIPWYTAFFCYPHDETDYGALVPCVNQTTGAPTGGMCTSVTTRSVLVCQPCYSCLTGSTVTVEGPTVSLWTPLGGSTVTGLVAVKGWAAHPSGTVDGVRVWVDNQPVSLLSYQTGLFTPEACAGQPKGCNPFVGFLGFLDTAGFAEGGHTLKVISVEDNLTTPGITVLQEAFVVDHTPPPSDLTPPTVSITAPTGGALVNGTVVVAANASDNVGVTKVEFYVDGVLKGTDTTSPFATSWNTTTAGDGTHSLTAKAFDTVGNVGVSPAVSVRVDNAVPRLYMEFPANNASVSGSAVRMAGWATDATRVTSLMFKLDGQVLTLNSPYLYGGWRQDVCNIYAGDPGCPYVGWEAFFDSRGFANGAHTLQVIAADGVGLTGSMQLTVVIANNDAAPTAAITAPAAGSNVRGVVVVQGQASDDHGVVRVEFYVDGVWKGSDTTAPCSYSWDTSTSADGAHALSAKAFDTVGNVSVSPAVSVRVDNAVPRLYMEYPANNASVSGSAVRMAGWATDATRVTSLMFKLDGQVLTLNSPYLYGGWRQDVCNIYPGDPGCPYVGWEAFFDSRGFANGTHTLQVIATDGVGLTGSMQLTVVIANNDAAPTAGITAPAAGSNVRGVVVVQGQASDDHGVVRVEFYVDGVWKGSDTTAPYSYSWDTSTSADGVHALSAKAFDTVGNVGVSPAVSVRVDNAVPRLYMEYPANNASVSGSAVRMAGWATDATRVTSLMFKLDGQVLTLNSPYLYGGWRQDVCNIYPGDPGCPYVGWEAFFDSRGFANGTHTLQVIATDGVGLTGSMQLTIAIVN